MSGNIKQTFQRGPLLYTILLHFILSLAIVTKCILLKLATVMPVFCCLPTVFFSGKINCGLYRPSYCDTCSKIALRSLYHDE